MNGQGVVKSVNEKVVKGGKVVYSFFLYNDDNLYRTGFDKPKFNVNDEVKFEYEQTRFGIEVDLKTVKSREGEPPKVTRGASAGGVKGKDDYWAAKDSYDKDVRQHLIMYQQATGVAAELAVAALNANIIPVGAAKKDKYENFLGSVRELRDELYSDYVAAVGKLEGGSPIIDEPEAVTEVPAIEEAEAPREADAGFQDLEEDDDWN